MKINFDKEKRFHLYHSEGGEKKVKWLTRINILFLLGNSTLLALELMNPRKYLQFFFDKAYSIRLLAWSLRISYRHFFSNWCKNAPLLLDENGK